jgi:hypothetical protein
MSLRSVLGRLEGEEEKEEFEGLEMKEMKTCREIMGFSATFSSSNSKARNV